jgi:hypothetical protein
VSQFEYPRQNLGLAGWFLGALAMAIAYVDGTQKDRIASLEFRVGELTRCIGG